jgi:hypothetical protein
VKLLSSTIGIGRTDDVESHAFDGLEVEIESTF